MENFKGFLRSFVYAFRGIKYMSQNERNFRFHITFMAYMFGILSLSDWFTISRVEYAVLILTCGSVISAEVFNTALENTVNLAKEEHSEYGRISKDTAAGAVLVNAIFAVITLLGGLIYGKEAMGLGDVKLMGALGLYFGLSNIIVIA